MKRANLLVPNSTHVWLPPTGVRFFSKLYQCELEVRARGELPDKPVTVPAVTGSLPRL